MLKAKVLLIPFLMLTSTPSGNLGDTNQSPPVYDVIDEETERFVDDSMIGKVMVTRLVKGESHKSYTLPSQKQVVYTEPEGQGLGYLGGRPGTTVGFGELSGSTKSLQISWTYSGLNHKTNITYKTGSTKSTAGIYTSPIPAAKALWKFQFILTYTIIPKRTDVYKYGVYQYSTMRYSSSFSRSHRWYRA